MREQTSSDKKHFIVSINFW